MWVAACNVYVSEGRDQGVIQQLKVAGDYILPCPPPSKLGAALQLTSAFAQAVAEQDAEVVLAHVFVDESYHRTGYTLASASSNRVRRDGPCRQTGQKCRCLLQQGTLAGSQQRWCVYAKLHMVCATLSWQNQPPT